MSNFCEHCQGQRFDRARVLRTLRQIRQELRREGRTGHAEAALDLALKNIAALDIPHLEPEEEEGHVIH